MPRYILQHAPHIVSKPIVEELERVCPQVEETRHHVFSTVNDVGVTCGLAAYYALYTDRAVIGTHTALYSIASVAAQACCSVSDIVPNPDDVLSICIQDVGDALTEDGARHVRENILEKLFPTPSIFEHP